MSSDRSPPVDPSSIGASVQFRANGTVRRLEADDLSSGFSDDAMYQSLLNERDFPTLALYVLEQYRSVLNLRQPAEELAVQSDNIDSLGYRQVRFRQTYDDRQVLASEIVVHFNTDDEPYLIQGDYMATPIQLDTTPAISAQAAFDSVSQSFSQATVGDARGPAIWVDDDGRPLLVYVLLVEQSMIDKSTVLVDANTGVIVIELPATYSQSL